MPCPFTVLAGIGAVGQAVPTLFVRDRAARPWVWSATALLAAGWTAYFLAGRDPGARMTLEAVSVAALVAAGWRWVVWARRHAGSGGARREVVASYRRTVTLLLDPWVLAALVWLTAMLVMEWRGKAEFVALEYVAVAGWVAAMLVWRRLRRPRVAIPAGRFDALESYARGETCPECPLGFGAATRAVASPEIITPREPEPIR